MHRLLLVVVLAACASAVPAKPAVPSRPIPEADPDLEDACERPEVPARAACTFDGQGAVVLDEVPDVDARFIDLRKMEGTFLPRGQGALVASIAAEIIHHPRATACAREVAEWHRAMALYNEDTKESKRLAFLAFAGIVSAGPSHPYFKDVGRWLDLFHRDVPRAIFARCKDRSAPVHAGP